MAENIPVRPRRRPGTGGDPPRAPRHLSATSRRTWDVVVRTWNLDIDGLLLLQGGLENLDLYAMLRRQVAIEGVVMVNPKTGMARQHPAARAMTDAYASYRMSFKQLGLEPPRKGKT
jgi:phage terminase small subunit